MGIWRLNQAMEKLSPPIKQRVQKVGGPLSGTEQEEPLTTKENESHGIVPVFASPKVSPLAVFKNMPLTGS